MRDFLCTLIEIIYFFFMLDTRNSCIVKSTSARGIFSRRKNYIYFAYLLRYIVLLRFSELAFREVYNFPS